MSYLEFVATASGFIFVWLEAKALIWSWPVAIVNAVLLFFLFYQVQLYPDMFLQIFYFIACIIGWWRWAHPKPGEADRKQELKVSYMSVRQIIILSSLGILGTLLLGTFAKNLHEVFPDIFQKPSAFPYLDSFVTVMSVITTFYMIQKKIECWIVWVLVDAVATYMYFAKGIKFVGVQYLIFTFISVYALWNWIREYKSYGENARHQVRETEV